MPRLENTIPLPPVGTMGQFTTESPYSSVETVLLPALVLQTSRPDSAILIQVTHPSGQTQLLNAMLAAEAERDC